MVEVCLELELGTTRPNQQEHRWGLGFVFLEICFPSLAWNPLDLFSLPLTLSTIATLPGLCKNMNDLFSLSDIP